MWFLQSPWTDKTILHGKKMIGKLKVDQFSWKTSLTMPYSPRKPTAGTWTSPRKWQEQKHVQIFMNLGEPRRLFSRGSFCFIIHPIPLCFQTSAEQVMLTTLGPASWAKWSERHSKTSWTGVVSFKTPSCRHSGEIAMKFLGSTTLEVVLKMVSWKNNRKTNSLMLVLHPSVNKKSKIKSTGFCFFIKKVSGFQTSKDLWNQHTYTFILYSTYQWHRTQFG